MNTYPRRARYPQRDPDDTGYVCLECALPECDEDDTPICAYVRAHARAQLARKFPWLFIELPKSDAATTEAPSIAKHPRMMPSTGSDRGTALCVRIGAQARADKWREQ